MINNPYIPTKVIDAGDMSAASIESAVINVAAYPNRGVQFVWTGNPVGTFSVSVASESGGTYTALSLDGAISNPTGSPGNFWLDLNGVNSAFMKVSYVKTSGSGALTVFVKGNP